MYQSARESSAGDGGEGGGGGRAPADKTRGGKGESIRQLAGVAVTSCKCSDRAVKTSNLLLFALT